MNVCVTITGGEKNVVNCFHGHLILVMESIQWIQMVAVVMEDALDRIFVCVMKVMEVQNAVTES